MQKDRAIRDHGDEHVQDPGGTAENKCVNEMGSGAGFPENQKEQENKNAGKGNGPQFSFPLFQKALLG